MQTDCLVESCISTSYVTNGLFDWAYEFKRRQGRAKIIKQKLYPLAFIDLFLIISIKSYKRYLILKSLDLPI